MLNVPTWTENNSGENKQTNKLNHYNFPYVILHSFSLQQSLDYHGQQDYKVDTVYPHLKHVNFFSCAWFYVDVIHVQHLLPISDVQVEVPESFPFHLLSASFPSSSSLEILKVLVRSEQSDVVLTVLATKTVVSGTTCVSWAIQSKFIAPHG